MARNTTLALQYNLDRLQDYQSYQDALLPGQNARDRNRHLLTARLTRLALHQNLTLSLFACYSPSDKDAYLRPKASYKVTDNWLYDVSIT